MEKEAFYKRQFKAVQYAKIAEAGVAISINHTVY